MEETGAKVLVDTITVWDGRRAYRLRRYTGCTMHPHQGGCWTGEADVHGRIIATPECYGTRDAAETAIEHEMYLAEQEWRRNGGRWPPRQ